MAAARLPRLRRRRREGERENMAPSLCVCMCVSVCARVSVREFSADAAGGGNSRGSGLAAPQAAPGAGASARGRAPGARGEARSVRSFPPRSPLICLCVDPDPPAPGRGDPAAARAEELPEALSPPRRCPGLTLREAQSRPVPVRLSLAPALSLWSSMYCNGCESGSQTQPPHSLRSVTLLSSQRRAYWLPPTHGARSLARYLPLS
ncbi:unnamed protein product [Rangifer tarandus platyrhynchus]|uniref:Uncharacterized protein n=2 Tax=Rangifer tarandus platyrhynchus TaxID=3082113 RepID=A0ABN8ZXG3_RANTA|nr:unnamed protein product [Rangifer tarandus platyrhynchus]CAI9712391.1 unnamed protein product [Rangifer tarandus platyrhynchus]